MRWKLRRNVTLSYIGTSNWLTTHPLCNLGLITWKWLKSYTLCNLRLYNISGLLHLALHSNVIINCTKVRKRAKIRNQYNQAPHLTQNTSWKVTASQLDITNKSQEVNPFPAGDHKASTNRRIRKHNKKGQNNTNDPVEKHTLERSVNIFTGGPKPVPQCTNLTLSSAVNQDT